MTQRRMTPNQVVAWNLWRERERRGVSQEQMSASLAQYGVVWEKPTYDAAEGSRDPDKTQRRFSADEILAFALAFDLPVAAFFIPPDGAEIVLDDRPVSRMQLMEAGITRDPEQDQYSESQRRSPKQLARINALRLQMARQSIRNFLRFEGEVPAATISKAIADVMNRFADVAPPPDQPEEVAAFIEGIRAEIAGHQESRS